LQLLLLVVVAIIAQMKQIFAVNNLMRLSPPHRHLPAPFSSDYAPQSTAATATATTATTTATSAMLLLHFIISAILSFAFYFSFNAINLALV